MQINAAGELAPSVGALADLELLALVLHGPEGPQRLVPQEPLNSLRFGVVGDQRRGEEVPQGMEAAVFLRPAGRVPPTHPLPRPGSVRERVAPRRGDQQRRDALDRITRGDVDQLDLARREHPDMLGELLGDHRV